MASFEMTRLLLAILGFVLVVGVSTSAASSENNRVSAEDDSDNLDSRKDHPDLDDLSSFFDFELVPPNRDHSARKPGARKYYYYYRPGGPMYPEHQYVAPDDKVTPGSHYKGPESNGTAKTATQIGNYQVSVVDADSPVLSDLGLTKDDLEKLSSMTRRSSSNGSLLGSDSIPPATYAENPRPDYNGHPDHNGRPDYNQYSSGGSYRPSEHHPEEDHHHHHHHRGYPSHPPPQGSYDAKSYASSGYSSNDHHASSYPPKRTSGEPWRATHTDWDDKVPKKNEGYHPHGSYHPPSTSQYHPPSPPSSSQYHSPSSPSSSQYHSTGSSQYHSPRSPSSSQYHPPSPPSSSSQYHPPSPSSSSQYHPPSPPSSSSKYPSSSSSSQYYPPRSSYPSTDKPGYRYKYPAPQKPTYSASSGEYPSSSKPSSSHHHHHPKAPPSRAGTYPHEAAEASKPGITIRFKAKTPGGSHGGGQGGGLSIPVNFNPLDVLKKLSPLASFNPLNNKKVTIGITIENKKEEHHGY